MKNLFIIDDPKSKKDERERERVWFNFLKLGFLKKSGFQKVWYEKVFFEKAKSMFGNCFFFLFSVFKNNFLFLRLKNLFGNSKWAENKNCFQNSIYEEN